MLEIPGIDPSMVDLYGTQFLKLIHKTEEGYKNIMRQAEDKPQDPNHQNVIEITSSDDEDVVAEAYSSDFDASEEEKSAYWRPAEAEEFNNRSKSNLVIMFVAVRVIAYIK